MKVSGIIFSNLHDKNVSELTRMRTMASIPFACRYRFIDFPLSNMVNAGITDVKIIAHSNYHSLVEHIGSGKDWDMARRSGGVKILPPYISAYSTDSRSLYNTRLEALKSVYPMLTDGSDDYIVMSDCDVICNMDIKAIIADHIKNNADITLAVKRTYLTPETSPLNVIVQSEDSCDVTDISVYPRGVFGYHDIDIHITVLSRKFFETAIMDAIAHGYKSFNRDILSKCIGSHSIRVYRCDGYFASINSLGDYYSASMDILRNTDHRNSIFSIAQRPIYTKVRNSPPTLFGPDSKIESSLFADGCIIEGRVENSIIFRGVKIGRGSVVKNSILFEDTVIGNSAELNCVITDKNTTVRDNRILSGHENIPFYIDKGKMI